MKKTHLSLILMFLFGFALNNIALSWNEGTHRNMSEYAAESSVLSMDRDDYFRNLGFIEALDTKFKLSVEMPVRKWLSYGAQLEDAGSDGDAIIGRARFTNHFHDPTKEWNAAGLTDLQLSSGESSLLWAQNSTKQENSIGGDWSWQKVRQVYYWALISTTDELRQINFAQTFRGLGHQMHLIQDTAQPSHVRNDAHPIDGKGWTDGLETWTKKDLPTLEALKDLPTPAFPNVTLNINYDGYAPITQFIDTKQYISTLIPDTSPAWGISEYTNSNFISDDTIFTENFSQNNGHYFPYPRYSAQCYEVYEENILPNKKVSYLRKKSTGECGGEFIEHFAVASPLFKYMGFNWAIQRSMLKLNSAVHRDYAQKLIPRAVGYSAGLLNYFFRGKLEITPPVQVAYAVTDGSNTPYYDEPTENYQQAFSVIKAKVRNNTIKEELSDGTKIYEDMEAGILQSVAKYKIIPNYMYDLSIYPPDGNVMKDEAYSYSVSAPITITSLSSTEATEFTFNFSTNPIPAGITDLYLQVVFKGTLGNENDIAVAVGMKDLMEPTHQVFWNATDMFKLDGHMYLSDTIETTPALADRVDIDSDGVFNENGEPFIDPHPVTFGIGYLSGPPGPANPFTYSAITTVQPGEYIRVIALFDKPEDNYLTLEKNDSVETETQYFHFVFPGVVNQEEEGVWQTPTPVTTFRYGLDIDGITPIPIRQHFHTAFFRCYPVEGTDPDGNPVCYYSEDEAIAGELLPSQIDTVYFP